MNNIIPKIPEPQTEGQYFLYAILVACLIAWALWLTLGKKKKWKGEERREGSQCMEHTKDIEKLKTESVERNAELQEFKMEMVSFKHDVATKFDDQRDWMEKKFDALNTTLIDILRGRK